MAETHAVLLQKISEVIDRWWDDRATANDGMCEIAELLSTEITVIEQRREKQ